MKICKDGRIWGQTNKGAGDHLGISSCSHIRKGGVKGNRNPMFGKTHSAEARQKMSEVNKGVNHWNWKGGISSIQARIRSHIESKLWRQSVLARDNWTCQECGKQGGRLDAHHIKSFAKYPELRFAIDNGRTLCFKCHKLINNFTGEVKI